MPPKQTTSGPSALRTFEDLLTFAWRGLALVAAVELDLFSHIAAGKTSARPGDGLRADLTNRAQRAEESGAAIFSRLVRSAATPNVASTTAAASIRPAATR